MLNVVSEDKNIIVKTEARETKISLVFSSNGKIDFWCSWPHQNLTSFPSQPNNQISHFLSHIFYPSNNHSNQMQLKLQMDFETISLHLGHMDFESAMMVELDN